MGCLCRVAYLDLGDLARLPDHIRVQIGVEHALPDLLVPEHVAVQVLVELFLAQGGATLLWVQGLLLEAALARGAVLIAGSIGPRPGLALCRSDALLLLARASIIGSVNIAVIIG